MASRRERIQPVPNLTDLPFYIYVPYKRHAPGEEVVTHFGARVPQVDETYAYTGTSLFDIAYSPGDVTSRINEHRVAAMNNASYSREAPDPLPTEGRIIWTEFTKFALERARTAREAVAMNLKRAVTPCLI